jgi:cation diffusion facilitator CzcD-associated flavoprotein CzcO
MLSPSTAVTQVNWGSFYTQYAPEIQQYFLDFAEKYNLRKYVKLNHKVVSARWDEEKGQYEVKVQTGDAVFTDWCHVMINGSGLINKWRCEYQSQNCSSLRLTNRIGPDIEGLHTFKGPLIHSAHWDRKLSKSGYE